MEIFSALLALCAGNSSVTGDFPSQRPATRSFDIFFDLCLNKPLSKHWWGWWFETPSPSLWRRHRHHYDVIVMVSLVLNFYQYLRVSVPLCWLQCVFLYIAQNVSISWWRHQMETFSALLAICAGNSPVSGEFPAQRPVTRNCDVYFDMHPNKRLSKQSWGWRFETQSRPLWRHRNVFRLSFSLVPILCGLCQLCPQRVSHTVCIHGSLYRIT